jgi:hypothetical protein
MVSLPALIEVWDRSADLHTRAPGASAAEIEEAEQRLGRRLPDQVRSLYEAMNGGELFEGDLRIDPLLPSGGEDDPFGVVGHSDFLRGAKWPIPPELVVFAADGTGDPFGVWMPVDQPDTRGFVVQVGAVFEEASFAVVGDDMLSFLVGWTAFYLVLMDEQRAAAALDVLGVPDRLRTGPEDMTEEDLGPFLGWASPGLPDPRPEAYEYPMTADDLRKFAPGAGTA